MYAIETIYLQILNKQIKPIKFIIIKWFFFLSFFWDGIPIRQHIYQSIWVNERNEGEIPNEKYF